VNQNLSRMKVGSKWFSKWFSCDTDQ
jgi:hypothetical protein